MACEINCTPVECVKLRRKHNSDLLDWASEIMEIYCCRPAKGNSDNLREFVADVFAAGRISGVREERRKKKRTETAFSSAKADIVKCLDKISEADAQLIAAAVHECMKY